MRRAVDALNAGLTAKTASFGLLDTKLMNSIADTSTIFTATDIFEIFDTRITGRGRGLHTQPTLYSCDPLAAPPIELDSTTVAQVWGEAARELRKRLGKPVPARVAIVTFYVITTIVYMTLQARDPDVTSPSAFLEPHLNLLMSLVIALAVEAVWRREDRH
jgi:hypothetical protein